MGNRKRTGLTKRAQAVLDEIKDLSGASPSKHTDFVALYLDVLLRSLTKRESAEVIRYLKKTYDLDLYGDEVKRMRAQLEKRLVALERKLQEAYDQHEDLLAEDRGREAQAYWVSVLKPLRFRVNVMLRRLNEEAA